MRHLLKRNGKYYYNRRVPDYLNDIDDRNFVRVSLKTDSRDIAIKRCAAFNQNIENYWQECIETGSKHNTDRFQKVVKLARLLGFSYMPVTQLANAPMAEIANRLNIANQVKHKQLHVEAIMGGVDTPSFTLTQGLEKYWELTKDLIVSKSPNQVRKWKNPRVKAIRNLVNLIGDKDYKGLTRDDIFKLRDWWITRMKEEGKKASSANKDLIHVKTIIETVNESERLNLDTGWLFNKIMIKQGREESREAFDDTFLKETLLKGENLAGLDGHERHLLYAFAETGAGLSELVGLEPGDITLDADIPHIHIQNHPGKSLKTDYRPRKIPLVGYALRAFQKYPEGFGNYKDKADSLSTSINKYLRNRNLLPSKKHSVYSLRHSFQDRLLAVNTPDRVQTDLMGHKFKRPEYGKGASLEQKLEWLQKIALNI